MFKIILVKYSILFTKYYQNVIRIYLCYPGRSIQITKSLRNRQRFRINVGILIIQTLLLTYNYDKISVER